MFDRQEQTNGITEGYDYKDFSVKQNFLAALGSSKQKYGKKNGGK